MMAITSADLRKKRDEVAGRLAKAVRAAEDDTLSVDKLAAATVERAAAETILGRLDTQIATAEMAERARLRDDVAAGESAAIVAAVGPALTAFCQFAAAVERLAEVYRISAPCPAETAHLVALAPAVKRTLETLRGLGIAGLPERKAEPDFQRRPEPPKIKRDNSAHYSSYPAVGPDSPGRHGAPDPTMFNPAFGR